MYKSFLTLFISTFLSAHLLAQPVFEYKNFTISYKDKVGWVASDKNQKFMYQVLTYDNGPDYPSEGLFRIIINGKMGYAQEETGKIIIQPIYSFAEPFEDGKAKVTLKSNTIQDGEHTTHLSEDWFYINKSGQKVGK